MSDFEFQPIEPSPDYVEYMEFALAQMQEIINSLNIPERLLTGDCTYSSGKLDHDAFHIDSDGN